MFGRIWRYLKALVLGKLDEMEDPEVLLQQAQREMRDNLAANRQRAITAITQKNNLKSLLDEQEKRIAQSRRRLKWLSQKATGTWRAGSCARN